MYTSKLDPDPKKLAPKLVTAIPSGALVPLSIGEGWVAVRFDQKDVRLFRIADGAARRLPMIDGVGWQGGQFEGLIIAGDSVWVNGYSDPGPYNNVKQIVRFEISALPDA